MPAVEPFGLLSYAGRHVLRREPFVRQNTVFESRLPIFGGST